MNLRQVEVSLLTLKDSFLSALTRVYLAVRPAVCVLYLLTYSA
jgi:hypothetical protein